MTREELIQYWAGTEEEPTGLHPDIAESIADFIIARDKRIVEPLLELDKRHPYWGSYVAAQMLDFANDATGAIEETLKNAGLNEKE